MTDLPGQRFRLRCVTPLFLAILTSVACAQGTDVFPLAKGMRYIYQHENSIGSWTEWWSNWSSDSGLVAYQVMDSARVNDTTIAWTIRQSRDVIVRTGHAGIGGGSDTTYQRADSTFVTLTEFTTGWHELRCESYVWQFPFPWFPGVIPAFRYSDSSHASMFYTFTGCHNMILAGNYDSLWFSQDSGLTRRQYSRCSENGENGSVDRRSSRLLTRILVPVDEARLLPSQYTLFQNYPNSFNPTTTIRYQTPEVSHVTLKVFDLLGRDVATLVDELKQPGRYTAQFDGSNLASGVYLYRLRSGNFVATRKMVLAR